MSKKIEMKELSLKTKIGETAYWTSLSGEVCVGVLKEWDNNTAIMITGNGKEKAVHCK